MVAAGFNLVTAGSSRHPLAVGHKVTIAHEHIQNVNLQSLDRVDTLWQWDSGHSGILHSENAQQEI